MGKEVERSTGGPIRYASQLGIIHKAPGLAGYMHESKARLMDQSRMIIESFPSDGFTDTLENVFSDMFNPQRCPAWPSRTTAPRG